MASGRKRLRNLAAETHPTYGETFLDRTDPSASSSGTASAQENVTESQSQGRSSAQEYVPPAQYVHLAQYELPPYSPQPTEPTLGPSRGCSMWQNVRPTINPDPTPGEQADLEQRSVHHSAEIFDDLNLNN
ncbi:hypothetical protein HID58_055358 [Brassica napus]|uniref:Uncharacterized protein n=1 Tax=Brassica napus TaxID=3708 RepID=A0ABQ8AK31_BRANA|nr:hypothetical protein HID58_055358 [Brassica napus]